MTARNAAQDSLTEARKLLGQPVAVVIGARTVQVRSYGFGQLFQVLAAAQPIVDAIAESPDLPVMQVLQAQAGHVATLMALSTGLPPDELAALPITDGLRLAHAVWQENADFFVQELTPMLVSAFASKMAKSSSNAAPTSSPAASAEATSLADGPPLPIG